MRSIQLLLSCLLVSGLLCCLFVGHAQASDHDSTPVTVKMPKLGIVWVTVSSDPTSADYNLLYADVTDTDLTNQFKIVDAGWVHCQANCDWKIMVSRSDTSGAGHWKDYGISLKMNQDGDDTWTEVTTIPWKIYNGGAPYGRTNLHWKLIGLDWDIPGGEYSETVTFTFVPQ